MKFFRLTRSHLYAIVSPSKGDVNMSEADRLAFERTRERWRREDAAKQRDAKRMQAIRPHTLWVSPYVSTLGALG